MKKQAGFTLMELLVALSIFGIIAAFAVVALNNARRDTRDMKRVADISIIKSALSLYYYNCNKYPIAVNAGNSISGHECDGAVYLANVPSDPNGSAYYYIPCIGSGEYRCALGQDNATWYEIKYSLEGNSSGLNKGAHIATPSGM
ncbi:type II secretion system protein [Candidatus Parcubacteria bacterium]|nr:type II secretion system protein [Candidatus Parcubacteria bacterium]